MVKLLLKYMYNIPFIDILAKDYRTERMKVWVLKEKCFLKLLNYYKCSYNKTYDSNHSYN